MKLEEIGVLFDLDGVLLDTEGIYSQFWDEVETVYPTGIPNFSQFIKGSNLETILNHFPQQHRAGVVEMLDAFQEEMRYDFFPGALEWVDTLYQAGVPMAIVTSSDRRKMEGVYAQHPQFRGYFKDVVVGEMVTQPKPSPECFLLGAQRIGVDIKNCYVFEDSINGLNAANASGAKVVGLDTTNPPEALQGLAPIIIHDFTHFTIEKMLAI